MSLRKLQSGLTLLQGEIVQVLSDLHQHHGVASLRSHAETGNGITYRRDQRVAEWCRTHGVPWHEYRQDGVVRRLRNRNGWSARWEKHMAQETAPLPRRYRDPGSTASTCPKPPSLPAFNPPRCRMHSAEVNRRHSPPWIPFASTQRLLSKRYVQPRGGMDWLQSLESLSGLGLSFDENGDTGSPKPTGNLEGPAGLR